MPGLVRDPSQNKTQEKWYGIIQFQGKLAFYDKRENHALRFLPAGWQCDVSEAKLIKVENPIMWGDTMQINFKIVDLKPGILQDQGVVIKKLYELEEPTGGRKKTMKDSGVKWDKDLGEPKEKK